MVLRGPSWIKRGSSRPFVALRGSKGVLRGPSWPFVDKKVFSAALRGPSWIKRCSPRPFVALRGSKGVLRGPSWPFVDQKVFSAALRGPSWIKRCSPRPFVALRGSKGVLRGPSWPKPLNFAAPQPCVALPSRAFLHLRGSICPFNRRKKDPLNSHQPNARHPENPKKSCKSCFRQRSQEIRDRPTPKS